MSFSHESFFSSLIVILFFSVSFSYNGKFSLIGARNHRKMFKISKRILHVLRWIIFTPPLFLLLLKKVILTTLLRKLVRLLIGESCVLLKTKEYVKSMAFASFLFYECIFSTMGLHFPFTAFEMEVLKLLAMAFSQPHPTS